MSGFYGKNDEIIQNVSVKKKNANSKRLKQFDLDLKTKRLHISTREWLVHHLHCFRPRFKT